MMKRDLMAMVLGVAVLFSGSASAAVLRGDFGSFQWGDFKVPAAYSKGEARGGALPITSTSPDGSKRSFFGFCLDVNIPFLQGRDYKVTSTPFSNNALSSTQLSAIHSVFEAADPLGLASGSTPLNFGTIKHSAGVALALWEVLYETSGTYDLSSGQFTASLIASPYPGEAEALSFAQGILGKINSGAATTNRYREIYLESTKLNESQNLVTYAPVPLPAAGMMLLAGIGGLVASARRSRTA